MIPKKEQQFIISNLAGFNSRIKMLVSKVEKSNADFETKRSKLVGLRSQVDGALAPFDGVDSLVDSRIELINTSHEITSIIQKLFDEVYNK